MSGLARGVIVADRRADPLIVWAINRGCAPDGGDTVSLIPFAQKWTSGGGCVKLVGRISMEHKIDPRAVFAWTAMRRHLPADDVVEVGAVTADALADIEAEIAAQRRNERAAA